MPKISMQMVARPLYSAFLHYKMNIFLSLKLVHSFFFIKKAALAGPRRRVLTRS
jgi:hypothetical protein